MQNWLYITNCWFKDTNSKQLSCGASDGARSYSWGGWQFALWQLICTQMHKWVWYWFLLYKLCPISAPDYRFIICVEKIGWHQDFGASILHQDLSSLPFCTQIQSQHVSTSKKKLQMDSATRIVVLNTWSANWSASNCLRIFVAREGAVAPPVHTKNWLQDYLMQVATTQPS